MRFSKINYASFEVDDSLIAAKRQANLRYMMSLDSDALLLNYRSEAILDNPFTGQAFKRHGGWEDPGCQLRGHFTGHWLSAAAMYYAFSGDMQIKAKADTIVAELALCQKANGGEWAASIPEKYLDRIASGGHVWAPHYTIHKTFMGLLDMYLLAGNSQALEIAENWAQWFLRWTAPFSREEMDNILDIETGGMLEIWALLYGATQKKEYLTLMERYYRGRLFDPLLEDKDVLTNMHANTTIPEILGAATAYEVTGEEKWLKIVKAYWKFAVTVRGAYATGGQTCGEVWTPQRELASRLGDKNQEHCTVYNMMRLAEFLLRVTGEKQYADYWEQNLYNGIFAQGHWQGHFTHGNKSPYPDHGLLTYFLPLRAGGRKAWSTETEDFFCCHGTLVQANASLNQGIYYRIGEGGLAVCQFFDSVIKTSVSGTGLELRQRIDRLNGREHFTNPDTLKIVLEIVTEKPVSFELKVRIPFWVKGEPVLYVNGEKKTAGNTGGWVSLKRNWNRDTVALEFKKGITAWPLPDRTGTAAFLYGPELLVGLCDEEISLKGDISKPEQFIVHDNEREWGVWINTFKTTGQPKNIRMVPLHRIGYEPYTVYFPVAL